MNIDSGVDNVEDSNDLAGFGYRQELDRTLGSFSSFAAGFSYISIMTGMFQMFYLGYSAGGGSFIWSWPMVFVGQFLVALFMTGVWHLVRRLREYFRHYTYKPDDIHYSITREENTPAQPFTRFSAYSFLIGGYVVSLGIGLFIGWHAQDFFADLTLLFRHHAPAGGGGSFSPTALLVSDLLFYPPIAVLVIDTMHGIASRIDTG